MKVGSAVAGVMGHLFDAGVGERCVPLEGEDVRDEPHLLRGEAHGFLVGEQARSA